MTLKSHPLLIIFLALSACATRYSAPEDYLELETLSQTSPSNKTTVFFLIDGLPVQTLKTEVQHHRLPQIEKHFLGPGQKLFLAHSVFPSLTYPNISGLLQAMPVHQTGSLGNTVLFGSKVIQFENVSDRPQFSEAMRGKSVFSRLTEKGRRSVSLDYGLGVDATVSAPILDIESGVAAGLMDYLYLDQKRIDSLSILLSNTKPDKLPEFIFVHLVGVDFLSHEQGPRSEAVLRYLRTLDSGLAQVFTQLRKAETANHQVITMLSADHGFMPEIKSRLRIVELVQSIDPGLTVFNEGRMAAVYSPTAISKEAQAVWAQKLILTPGLEIVTYRLGNTVRVLTKKTDLRFELQATSLCPESSMLISIGGSAAVCPGQLELKYQTFLYPFLIENLAYYFQSEKRPDLVIIPGPGVAFNSTEMGFHGGPTVEETVVPLLLRNAKLQDETSIPANWELLRFL